VKPEYQVWSSRSKSGHTLILIERRSFGCSPVQLRIRGVETGMSSAIDDPGHDVTVSRDRVGHEKSAQGEEKLNLVLSARNMVKN
jgi:hypothetical protein